MGNLSSQKEDDLARESPGDPLRETAPLRGGAVMRWRTADSGVLLLASHGGPVAPPEPVERLGGLADLRQRLPPETIIGYRGCDAADHYFRLPSGPVYRVPRRCWAVTAMPVTLGFCIPLVFSGDRLVIPPADWSNHLDLHSLQWTLDA